MPKIYPFLQWTSEGHYDILHTVKKTPDALSHDSQEEIIMKKRRCIAWILAFLMILPLVACQKESNEDNPQTATAEVTPVQETEPEETIPLDDYGRPIIEDTVPEGLDFDGVTLNYITSNEYLLDCYIEEMNGELLNDLLYNRWAYAEQELNVNFSSTLTNYDATHTPIQKAVKAGDTSYDCTLFHRVEADALAPGGYLLNLYDVPYIDLEQVWWSSDMVDEMTWKDKLYVLTGDVLLSSVAYVSVIFFNKNMAEKWLPDTDLYQLVKDYNWTLDTFQSLNQRVYSDENGNGEKDPGDIYGLLVSSVDQLMLATDVEVTARNNDGSMSIALLSEKLVDRFDKFIGMLHNTNGILKLQQTTENNNLVKDAFAEGRVLFRSTLYKNVVQLRDMKDDYGVLPNPMADESSGEYRNNSCHENNLLAVISNCQKTEALGAALELMAAYSYRHVIPAFFEVSMKYKYSRIDGANDPQFDMFDIITSDSHYDFGFIFGDILNNPLNILRSITQEDKPYVSTITSNMNAMESALERLLAKLESPGE